MFLNSELLYLTPVLCAMWNVRETCNIVTNITVFNVTGEKTCKNGYIKKDEYISIKPPKKQQIQKAKTKSLPLSM